MKKALLLAAAVFACTHLGWAIYGPSLTRADTATALRACEEANFSQGTAIAEAMRSGDPAKIVLVLGGALEELRGTSFTSDLSAARHFCIHELVLSQLPREGEIASPAASRPTALIKSFQDLGVNYFYYGPDAAWTLEKNPVDLNQLAGSYLDSPWGRRAFLMMTHLGWSQGECREGPDQFREVIKHSEKFLVEYPDSEVSDDIRLELANAYATWWNVSHEDRNPPGFYPEAYAVGAAAAKQRAVELYEAYLKAQKKAAPEVDKQLKSLRENPKGSGTLDYFCADYAD